MRLTRLAFWVGIVLPGLAGAAFALRDDTPVSSDDPPAKKKPAQKKDKVSPEPASPIKVRALKVKQVPLKVGGKNKATTAKTLAELEKVVGKALAAELGKQVKFATEQVVLVSYQTSGAPFGVIKYEIKGKGKKTVEFYCQEPKGVVRDSVLTLRAEFFAVTRGTPVKYTGAK